MSIDLDLAHLGTSEREAALAAVRARVGAVPGAGWISVEPHEGAELEARLFPPGSSLEAHGERWSEWRARVEQEVREVLRPWRRLPATDWRPPARERTGFAETLAPQHLDALQQLAALAEISRAPAPEPEPQPEPDTAGDVARLASLLGLVLPVDGQSAAQSAIRRFGSFAAVLAAPEAELRRVPGLGSHSVAAIKLVHAAAVRLARAGLGSRPLLDDRPGLAGYLAAALGRERVEQFRILFLDERGMLLADEVQARGTVNHTPVYPREVVRRALALGAHSLILVHNHPSGDPAPSREDIDMTADVAAAASVMGLSMRDHLIVGNGRWLSFRDEGLLRQRSTP